MSNAYEMTPAKIVNNKFLDKIAINKVGSDAMRLA